MKKLNVPDKNILYDMYVVDNMSMSKIAAEFGTSAMTVRAWLNERDIKTRISTVSIYKELRDTDFSDLQKNVLIGSILGDGGLRVPKKGKNAHFFERHCEKQRMYLEWKKDLLMPFVPKKLCFEEGGPHVISGIKCVVQNSYKLVTIAHSHLTYLWKIFYRGNGNKVLPKDIEDYLNLFVMAIWIADDGSLVWNTARRTYRIDLHTENFTYDENLLLCRALYRMFKGRILIIPRQYKSGEKYYLSLRGKQQLHTLCGLLKELVPECMTYKFITHI